MTNSDVVPHVESDRKQLKMQGTDLPRQLLLLTDSEVTPPLPPPAGQSSLALYVGPGRLIARGIDKVASFVEPAANWAFHCAGKGPDAITQNIEEIFDGNCESTLTDLHALLEGTEEKPSQDIRRLEKECRKLISFADQQQTNGTLLQVFQSIVVLTTRYPGLRRMFLRSTDKPDSELKCQITALRMHDDGSPKYQWDLLKPFALVSLERNRVNNIIESHAPNDLALASHGEGLCVIEKLLGFCRDSDPHLDGIVAGVGDPLLRPLAVRFLAGILHRHPFWTLNQSLKPDGNQIYVAGKLCDSAVQLVEDIPVDIDRDQRFKLDVVGLDAFLAATLDGLHNWMLQLGWRHFRGCDGYKKLIELLQHSGRKVLFPLATERAIRFHPLDARNEGGSTTEEDIEEDPRTSSDLSHGEGEAEYNAQEQTKVGARPSVDPPHVEDEVEHSTGEEIRADTQTNVDPSHVEDEVEHSTGEEIRADTRTNAVPSYDLVRTIDAIKGIRQDDIIIAFMGPTGCGKSYFIDLLTGQSGRRFRSTSWATTSQIEATRLRHPVHGDRIVFVDTPGFDDTTRSDMQILEMISNWLVKLYEKNVKLSGIVYLHRITDNRMAGAPFKNLRIFGELCGDKVMGQVTIVTTMWGRIQFGTGAAREAELKRIFWRAFMDKGARIDRLRMDTSSEAWRIVDASIRGANEREAVLLQEEMVDLGKELNETQAGRTLHTSLQKLLADQRDDLELLLEQVEKTHDPALQKDLRREYAKIEAQFQKTFREVKETKIPLGRRAAELFFPKKTRAKAIRVTQL